MKKTLRKILGIGAVAAAGVLPMEKAEAQFNGGSVGYVHSGKSENSYGRLLGFYELPAEISGFSFVEFYKNGSGYYGETTLNKGIKSGLTTRVNLIHAGEPVSEAGFGVGFNIPRMPKGGYASIGFLPVWVGRDGSVIDKAQAQYSFGFSLPKGFNLGGFGEWNLLKKGGPQWGYGELEATVDLGEMLGLDKLKGIRVGYNPALLPDGDAVPSVRQRGIAKFTF